MKKFQVQVAYEKVGLVVECDEVTYGSDYVQFHEVKIVKGKASRVLKALVNRRRFVSAILLFPSASK